MLSASGAWRLGYQVKVLSDFATEAIGAMPKTTNTSAGCVLAVRGRLRQTAFRVEPRCSWAGLSVGEETIPRPISRRGALCITRMR